MTDPATDSGPTELSLRKPRFWSERLLVGLAVLAPGIAMALLTAIARDVPLEPRFLLVLLLAIAPLVIGTALVHWLTLARVAPAIRFTPEALLLPRSANSRRTSTVPYADVLSVDVRYRGRFRRLFVGTRKRTFHAPLSAFVDPDPEARFRRLLKPWVQGLPDGVSLWDRIVARGVVAGRAMARKPLATMSLVCVITLVCAGTVLAGAWNRPFVLVDFGANAPLLVRDGQWHRLVAANFLHASPIHIIMNAAALWILGTLCERLMGSARLLLVYSASAVGGALASTLFARATFSVGASTAIFGLLGALAVLNWRFYGELPAVFRQPVHAWVFVGSANALLPLLLPQIDVAAHIGGFAVGAAVTALLYGRATLLDGFASPGKPLLATLLAVGAVACLALGRTVARAAAPPESDQVVVAEHFARAPSALPLALNEVAWSIATAEESSDRLLSVANTMAARAVDEEPGNSAFLDTLATTQHRLGEWDAAVATERRAIGISMSTIHFTQLARFLRARDAAEGHVTLGDAQVRDVALEFTTDDGERAIVARLDRDFAAGLVVFAHSRAGDRDVGLLRVELGPDHERELRFTDENDFSFVPDDARLEVALLDATGSDLEAGKWRWTYRSTEESFAELP